MIQPSMAPSSTVSIGSIIAWTFSTDSLDVAVVEITDVGEGVIECAGAFTHLEACGSPAGEQTDRGTPGHVLALADQLFDADETFLDDAIADDGLRRADRIEDRDARRIEQREGVREAGQDDLARDVADHRQAQLGNRRNAAGAAGLVRNTRKPMAPPMIGSSSTIYQ